MISKQHSNRKAYNWLVYDIGDKYILKYKKYYHGVLYDLGCGTSPFKSFFLNHVEKYIGVDWGSTLHASMPDIIADLNTLLPIENAVADTIISISVMEHLKEPQVMLNEAFRILKNEGTIILQVPFQWQIHEKPYDFYRYTPYALEYMFLKAGFKVIEITPSSGFFTTWFMKFNYFTLRLIRGNKILRYFITLCLHPVWYLTQIIAPFLDKLDNDWAAETQGFWVVAQKTN